MKPANDTDAALTRRIDELFTAWPFLGSRRMTATLRAEGVRMKPQAGAAADAPDGDRRARAEAENEQTAPGHKIYPYLLRDMMIERANPV